MIDVIKDRIVRKNPFLRDWSNYGIIDIFNPAPVFQYPHEISITPKPGMAYDFRDVRFFQADGTKCPYWIQAAAAGTSATIKVNTPSSYQGQIYCFYGNRDVVSETNSAATFPIFVDEFLGTTLNAAKWTSSGVVAVDGTLKLGSTVNSDVGSVTSVSSFPINTTLEMMAKMDTAASGTYQMGYYDTQYVLILGSGATLTPYNNDGVSANGTNMGNLDAYHTWVIKRNGTTSTIFSVDGGGVQTLTTHVPTISLKMRHTGGGQAGKLATFDYIHIRPYVATEPTCQFNTYGLKV